MDTSEINSNSTSARDLAGWTASLDLRLARRGSRTVLVDRSHTGPLVVQKPFYPENEEICHLYLVHPPGGFVGGDKLATNISMEQGAWGIVTTPGASKVYRCLGNKSVSQIQRINLADNSKLEWLPQETIYFNSAAIESVVHIELDSNAKFIGWDISCFGLPASNEPLRQCNIRQRFEIWDNGTPLLLERNRYKDDCSALKSPWGLQGCSVSGYLVSTEGDESLVAEIRNAVSSNSGSLFSVTMLHRVLICRYLGNYAEEARALLKKAWGILRPPTLGIDAVDPRIWNT